MQAEHEVISVSRKGISLPDWKITAPRLKLALKYGIGPSPWKSPNWSVEFDRYASGRGPNAGLPSLVDLSVTNLMNSRVVTADLKRATAWLAEDQTHRDLNALRDRLRGSGGLADLTVETIADVGNLVDQMRGNIDDGALGEDGRRPLYGFGLAKPFKWFAAWAPAHIPMIDSKVAAALTDIDRATAAPDATVLLTRFRELLLSHQRILERLSVWLARQLDNLPIPPVRVLDSLLWLDWWGCCGPEKYFSNWINPDENRRDHYALTPAGEHELNNLESL